MILSFLEVFINIFFKFHFQVGISSTLPVMKTVLQLIQTMILPVCLGQISQKLLKKDTLSHIPFSLLGQMSLLFIIYSSFCDMFSQDDYNMDAHVVLMTVLLGKMSSVYQFCISFKKFFLFSSIHYHVK